MRFEGLMTGAGSPIANLKPVIVSTRFPALVVDDERAALAAVAIGRIGHEKESVERIVGDACPAILLRRVARTG